MPRVRRSFVDGRYGQIHVRTAQPDVETALPLACLHMSPKSGRIFATFMAAAADDRMVIAPDYPGFGESDPPPETPNVTIEDYAASLWEVTDALAVDRLDLLGYHTGCLVAAEAARQQPDRVGGIVMISAPVFSDAELKRLHETYRHIPLDLEGTRFRRMWQSVVDHRGPGMTLEMMATSFAENLRAGERYEWGHRAAFAYAPKYPDVVAALDHRITVLNPADDLHAHTPRIERHLKNGEVLPQEDWGHGFLDAFSEGAATVVKRALDG